MRLIFERRRRSQWESERAVERMQASLKWPADGPPLRLVEAAEALQPPALGASHTIALHWGRGGRAGQGGVAVASPCHAVVEDEAQR